jgi:hypothetical protein
MGNSDPLERLRHRKAIPRDVRREILQAMRKKEDSQKACRKTFLGQPPGSLWRAEAKGATSFDAQTIALYRVGERFGGMLPTPSEWAEFHATQIAPVIQLLWYGYSARCEACGEPLVVTAEDKRFCSEACAARARKRRLDTKKKKSRRPSPDRRSALRLAKEKWQQHRAECPTCSGKGRRMCSEGNDLLQASVAAMPGDLAFDDNVVRLGDDVDHLAAVDGWRGDDIDEDP